VSRKNVFEIDALAPASIFHVPVSWRYRPLSARVAPRMLKNWPLSVSPPRPVAPFVKSGPKVSGTPVATLGVATVPAFAVS
jgi:hypothetical protein